jgi:glycosyltransferase involved in cell wall biosynthesis
MSQAVSGRVGIVAASLDILGGQGVQARTLLDALTRDGWRVIFVPINVGLPPKLAWLRRFRGVRTVVNELLYLPSLARLAAVDVVHAFSGSYWSFLLAPVPAMILGRFLGKHVVLHYHSGEAEDHLARWGWLVRPWLRLADVIVVPSEYLRGVFANHGVDVEVVPNVVDLTRFRYREREAPLRPRLLSARNLEAYYRVDLIIDAFARVRTVEPGATLTVAGYGSQEQRLRQLAASVAGDAIRFVGKVEPADMPRVYDEHDLFVNASVVDNQPVSILEAFAAGIPVVSTPTGDIPCLVQDGDTGRLSAVDATALAETIISVLRTSSAAIERAARARDEVNRFTWPAVRERWQAIYTKSSENEIAAASEAR